MSVKNHCDVCDAVCGNGKEVDIKLVAGNVELRGMLTVRVHGRSEAMICHDCVKKLFLKGTPVIEYPLVNLFSKDSPCQPK